jgi:iron complex outermembrane receptor protein
MLFWRIGADYNDTEVLGGANAGKELIWAPKWSVTTGLDYTFPVADGMELTLHGDMVHVEDQWVNGFNTILIPSYEKGNVSFTLRGTKDTQWCASFYVNNVTDENYLANFAQLQSDSFYSKPRQYGIEVSWYHH